MARTLATHRTQLQEEEDLFNDISDTFTEIV
jgi:hypothetical protein